MEREYMKKIVVGMRKNNKKAEPIFQFSTKIKNTDPKLRHMIAPTKRIDAIRSGIPFENIYSTVLPKPVIFPGMADMNIADITILAKKSKKGSKKFIF